MYKLALALAAVLALVIAIPMGAYLAANNATPANCSPGTGVAALAGPDPVVSGLSAAQVQLARVIWSRAHAHPDQISAVASDQAAVIAIAVASQESSLGANPSSRSPNTDGDAGPFQQRTLPGWYGTVAQVNDPVYATDTFLLGHTVTLSQYVQATRSQIRPAGTVGYHIPGLVDIPGWTGMSIVDAAQRVQRSAFPDAVGNDIPVARSLVATFDASGSDAAAITAKTTSTCGSASTCDAGGLPNTSKPGSATSPDARCIDTTAPNAPGVGIAVTPIEHYTITAHFGEVGPWARYHTGLDFAAPIGTPVLAALTGVVTHAGYGPAAPWAGNYVTIRHADGTSTLYAHMARHDVTTGQSVTTGQQIGVIGVTGRSFGPHLHFEVYPVGISPGEVYRAVDPAQWLANRGIHLT